MALWTILKPPKNIDSDYSKIRKSIKKISESEKHYAKAAPNEPKGALRSLKKP